MKVLIGADQDGTHLKEVLKDYLAEQGYDVIDKTPEANLDFVDSAVRVVRALQEKEGDRGILIDKFGAGSFLAANKCKGMICAEVSDEHSAKMTRNHNNTMAIALGSGIVGEELAKGCVDAYLNSEYAGGRHQIRVDMLNRMC
ncbi:galactose-6-phosphate isomerase subunit LacA [Bacillus sonorensis]|uniref:Galactose-6-phosphate isomerase subunit LacA n=2 Tax=Bacillus sonorensis TaxID=119858 RepID=M5PDG5_9BACI|nr:MULTISPECIES: galactose-6-phosphate isomerase subunit LacA [Bacillus]TWK83529.1 Galactose-6-phosphate isomerase subunit LacA [Bacillus paralicheniformis]ASB91393.1 Galactose-6-phosphate isomerase [Bacillus sonorensis]EME73762.1 galactose-6-phosphate isomerase subunit LacA [Bacillus sonorensis L12]MBG9914709.1 galactose-6-phosphate isomerase [Bacillus sonorensis]MCF7615997.1 galactose-6-phosphate isomerase subunit LacA [Bacillus sonorensis]